MNDRDWSPNAALVLLQEQLRLGRPVPETDVAKLWTVPRIKVSRCVEYLRSVGFTISKVHESRLTSGDVVRRTGEVSYYVGRPHETDVPAGPGASGAEEAASSGSALPALWREAEQADQLPRRRRGREAHSGMPEVQSELSDLRAPGQHPRTEGTERQEGPEGVARAGSAYPEGPGVGGDGR